MQGHDADRVGAALSVNAAARLRSVLAKPDGKHVTAILGAVAGLLDAGGTVSANSVTTALGFDSPAAKVWMGSRTSSEPEYDGEWVEQVVNSPNSLIRTFPVAALYGLAGDFVNAYLPTTEASPAALLVELLASVGAMVGRSTRAEISEGAFLPSICAIIVGLSAKARKGSARGIVQKIIERVDPTLPSRSGLSSGEGLIRVVRDPDPSRDDPGATDKRLRVYEPEFASVLAVKGREGNTLSARLRDIADGVPVGTMTQNPLAASDYSISIVGHITEVEFKGSMRSVDIYNGLLNRFLIVESPQRDRIPKRMGEATKTGPSAKVEDDLIVRLRASLDWAQTNRLLDFTDDAFTIWAEIYTGIMAQETGVPSFDALTARAEFHVLKIAVLHAILDRSEAITVDHLLAALALVDYSHESVGHLFGAEQLSHDAHKLIEALRDAWPAPLVGSEVHRLFHNHKTGPQLREIAAGLKNVRVERHRQHGPGPSEVRYRLLKSPTEIDVPRQWGCFHAHALAVAETHGIEHQGTVRISESSELAPDDEGKIEADLLREFVQ